MRDLMRLVEGLDGMLDEPVVRLMDEPRAGESVGSPTLTYHFEVSHASLASPALFNVEFWPEMRRGNVNAYGSMANVNSLGTSAIRSIMRQVKAVIPDLESLQGERVTGVRAGARRFRDRFQRVDVTRA